MRLKQKRTYGFYASIAALLIGAWMIFYLKNNWGFVPSIIGAFYLILKKNGK